MRIPLLGHILGLTFLIFTLIGWNVHVSLFIIIIYTCVQAYCTTRISFAVGAITIFTFYNRYTYLGVKQANRSDGYNIVLLILGQIDYLDITEHVWHTNLGIYIYSDMNFKNIGTVMSRCPQALVGFKIFKNRFCKLQ